MVENRRKFLLALARLWAYPLWFSAIHSESADAVTEDVDWWIQCMNVEELRRLDRYSRFSYLAGALPEFRNLVHYRLRSSPAVVRLLLRVVYRPEPTLTIDVKRIGPGLFIQHGFATVIDAETIGSHCWINQQVTIGYDARGKPTLRDDVRVGAGAMVIGRLTLHDGAIVGINATVIHDVSPGETVVAPLATPLQRRQPDGGEPA
jgi:serine O-acetyltransferase